MHQDTVKAVALKALVLQTEGGVNSVERNAVIDWPADDFERAKRNGLVRAAEKQQHQGGAK